METILSLTRTTSFQVNGQYIPSKKLIESFFKDYDYTDVQVNIWIIIDKLDFTKVKYPDMMEHHELTLFLEDLHDLLMECYLSTTEARKKAANSETRPQS